MRRRLPMTMHCTLCTQGMLKIGATVTHFPSSSLFVVLVVSPSCFPRSQDCYPYLTRDREIQFFSPLLSTPSRSQSSVSDFFFGNMAEYGTELLKRQLNGESSLSFSTRTSATTTRRECVFVGWTSRQCPIVRLL